MLGSLGLHVHGLTNWSSMALYVACPEPLDESRAPCFMHKVTKLV